MTSKCRQTKNASISSPVLSFIQDTGWPIHLVAPKTGHAPTEPTKQDKMVKHAICRKCNFQVSHPHHSLASTRVFSSAFLQPLRKIQRFLSHRRRQVFRCHDVAKPIFHLRIGPRDETNPLLYSPASGCRYFQGRRVIRLINVYSYIIRASDCACVIVTLSSSRCCLAASFFSFQRLPTVVH